MGWFSVSRTDGKGILGEVKRGMRYLKERKEHASEPNGDEPFLLEVVIELEEGVQWPKAHLQMLPDPRSNRKSNFPSRSCMITVLGRPFALSFGLFPFHCVIQAAQSPKHP